MKSPPSPLSGAIARLLLSTLQQVSGPQYPRLLQQAGLERYLTTLPDPAAKIGLAAEEIARLNRTVWTQLGEDLFRLYERNMGAGIAQGIVEGPLGAQLQAGAATRPQAERLRWTLEAYRQRATGTPAPLTEDAQAFYLAINLCAACWGITGAATPICVATGMVIRQLLEHAVGGRVRVEETACQAQGAPSCLFAVYK